MMKATKVKIDITPHLATKPIKTTTLLTPPPNDPIKPKKKGAYKHSGNRDRAKQSKGKKSEQDVYNSLIEKYGNDCVVWVAKDDDSLGYDIKYRNDLGEWKYVEVKTYSRNIFYLTKNEKEFSEKHKGDYEIFLVGDDIHKITNIDFSDKTKFHLVGNEFIVNYVLEIS